MGREVRKVPADWRHPKNDDGHFIPLHRHSFAVADAEWDEGYAKWQEGLTRNYGGGDRWAPIDDEDRTMRFTEYHGSRPSPDDYMPDWPEDQRTHLMMYEDTSEGTPISAAFETPEELARWLADNGASAFANDTATYEQWLSVCRGGFAPSMVIDHGVIKSGVEFMGEKS